MPDSPTFGQDVRLQSVGVEGTTPSPRNSNAQFSRPHDSVVWGTEITRQDVGGIPFLLYCPRPKSLPDLLTHAQRWAKRPYLKQSDHVMTFAEFEELAWRGATMLTSFGVKPGDRVLLLAANGPDWIVAFWSIALVGGVNVLGNCWWSAEEVAGAVKLTEPVVTVTDEWTSSGAPSEIAQIPVSEPANCDFSGAHRAPPPTVEHDPAAIIFTSGTTGASRGATISHRSLIALQHTLLHRTSLLSDGSVVERPSDVTLQTAPLFHIGGVQAMLRALVTGSTMVLPRGRFDPALVLEIIEAERVQRWGAVPTMVSRVLDHPDVTRRDVTSLRSVNLGGSPIPAGLVERIVKAFPNTLHGVGKIYGLTEAGGTLTSASAQDVVERPGTVGRPVPLAEIRIQSPNSDGVGEILARSASQMDGYWGLPDAGIIDQDGWIHTGDLGYLDSDGFLFVTGRSKDVIIRGGENIASAHVEDVLVKHPAVVECAVLGLPDDDLGEVIAAAVVLRAGSAVGPDALAEYLRGELAYFEIPSYWWIHDSPLPCNATGKVNKRLLAAAWPVISS